MLFKSHKFALATRSDTCRQQVVLSLIFHAHSNEQTAMARLFLISQVCCNHPSFINHQKIPASFQSNVIYLARLLGYYMWNLTYKTSCPRFRCYAATYSLEHKNIKERHCNNMSNVCCTSYCLQLLLF